MVYNPASSGAQQLEPVMKKDILFCCYRNMGATCSFLSRGKSHGSKLGAATLVLTAYAAAALAAAAAVVSARGLFEFAALE